HTELDGPWLHGPRGQKAYEQAKAIGRRAGVEGATLLAFRHAFATAADHFQIGTKALQDLMGHSSPATQWGYRHTEVDQLRMAPERARFAPPPAPLPTSPAPPPTSPGA